MLLNVVNLHHVSLPVVFSRESFTARSRIITAADGAVELLLLLVPVVDVSLKMSLGAEAFATVWVRALVVFAMVSLVVSRAKKLAS